jgi:putative phage-type endonuclease
MEWEDWDGDRSESIVVDRTENRERTNLQLRISDNLRDISWDEVHEQVKYLLTREGPEYLSAEYHQNRNRIHFVTASMVAVIAMGRLQFGPKCRTDTHLLQMILGLREREPPNEATEHGHRMEAFIASMYAERTGEVLFDHFPAIQHPLIPWMACTPDRITASGRNVEIKAPYYKKVVPEHYANEDAVKRHVPYYWHQLQMQMFVMNLQESDFVVCGLPPNKNHPTMDEAVYCCCRVPYDPMWWPSVRGDILTFAARVFSARKEVPPPIPTCMF